MKKSVMGWGLGVLAAFTLFSSDLTAMDRPARARPSDIGLDDELFKSCMVNVKKDCENWALKGGGSDSPHGLDVATKVELAQGEKYILTGVINIDGSDAFLRINLKEQAWLASRVRVKNPFYRIDDSISFWKKYDGRKVTIVATARYRIGSSGAVKTLEIFLEPGEDPVIEGLQRSRSY